MHHDHWNVGLATFNTEREREREKERERERESASERDISQDSHLQVAAYHGENRPLEPRRSALPARGRSGAGAPQ